MDQIYIIGIVVFGVIGGLLAILHYKKQGKITEEFVDVVEDKTKEAIDIARDFLQIVDLGDGVEKTINTVLNATEDIVHYVANSVNPNTNKKQITVDVVNAILDEFKINTTEQQQKLIGIVVDNSIRRIEKNHK